MEVVINDIKEIKKYTKVSHAKKEIRITFDNVIFNCVLPSKICFDYFQEESVYNYEVVLKANKVVFNYSAECDQIYAMDLISKDILICNMLNVIGDVDGDYIKTNICVANNISALILQVNKIICNHLQARTLQIKSKEYLFITADSINNIGGRDDRN